MRLFMFVLYYGLAVLLGFTLRGRFDVVIYRRSHMQRRLVVWAADVCSYYEQGGEDVVLPPSTLDADAWSRPRPAAADHPGLAPAPDSPPASRARAAGTPSPDSGCPSATAETSSAPQARPMAPS